MGWVIKTNDIAYLIKNKTIHSKSPMKKPTLPPPSAKSKPKSRAAAQKAKKLFAMDGYSIFDESP